jgi:hypothetical protein
MKHHIRLLVWKDFYGLKPYLPAFSALRQEPKDSEVAVSTAWLYGFKKHFKNSDDVKMIVEALASHFRCDVICPVPPSTPEDQPNSLQRLFGDPIRRIKAAESRKYNHQKQLPDDYAETYEITIARGERILLVDDILRTGITLDHYRKALSDLGMAVVPLALGFYYKLYFQYGDSISIFTEKSEMEMSLEKMIFEI